MLADTGKELDDGQVTQVKKRNLIIIATVVAMAVVVATTVLVAIPKKLRPQAEAGDVVRVLCPGSSTQQFHLRSSPPPDLPGQTILFLGPIPCETEFRVMSVSQIPWDDPVWISYLLSPSLDGRFPGGYLTLSKDTDWIRLKVVKDPGGP
jgi:hypothetical protein